MYSPHATCLDRYVTQEFKNHEMAPAAPSQLRYSSQPVLTTKSPRNSACKYGKKTSPPPRLQRTVRQHTAKNAYRCSWTPHHRPARRLTGRNAYITRKHENAPKEDLPITLSGTPGLSLCFSVHADLGSSPAKLLPRLLTIKVLV